MTEEEKSEITKEYLNNTFKQTEANQLAIMIGSKCFYEGLEKGLSEGGSKWHDLRKDPNDLPKHSGLYCVQCGEVREYVKEEKSWFTVDFKPCLNRTEETYLWCEIPKFEEKK